MPDEPQVRQCCSAVSFSVLKSGVESSGCSSLGGLCGAVPWCCCRRLLLLHFEDAGSTQAGFCICH